MKNRKILAFILALLMLASVYTPTFAASRYSTKIKALCKLPTIQVTVPASGSVYLNPSKINMKVSGQMTDEQIISEPAYIANESEVPVEVSISAVGKVRTGSAMQLATSSTKGSGLTTKQAFLYLELHAVNDMEQTVSWDSGYNAAKHVLVSKTEQKVENIATLGALEQENSMAVFRMAGDCTEKPKAAWNAKDCVDVTVSFTFKPQEKS